MSERQNITVHFKDGERAEYRHHASMGWERTNEIRYVEGFAIVLDQGGKQTAWPTADIARIEVAPA